MRLAVEPDELFGAVAEHSARGRVGGEHPSWPGRIGHENGVARVFEQGSKTLLALAQRLLGLLALGDVTQDHERCGQVRQDDRADFGSELRAVFAHVAQFAPEVARACPLCQGGGVARIRPIGYPFAAREDELLLSHPEDLAGGLIRSKHPPIGSSRKDRVDAAVE